MPSNSWSISADANRSVPRNSMCSRKCDRPASSTCSPRDPAPMKKPRATDRTEGMCSVTTRSPESSVVSRWAGNPLAAVRVAVAAVPATAAADRRELLLALADDVGVLGEAQADAAALLVDLDDADGDLVALVEHLLDRRDPLAGRDVRDVQQAVGALGELHERAERRRLDDLRGLELVAD